MRKGAYGREGNVGSLAVDCEARCGLAVEDTSKFVEPHNILHKILVFLGTLFLANSRCNIGDVIVCALEWQRRYDVVPGFIYVHCVHGYFLTPRSTPIRASKPRIPYKN